MEKNVLITIRGKQQEGEPIEIIVPGEHYLRNGKHYLLYEEIIDEDGGISKNRVKVGKDVLEVSKQGVATTQMVFCKGKEVTANYHTPYGLFLMSLRTKELEIEETEDRLQIRVRYVLELNGDAGEDCVLDMTVVNHNSNWSI